MAKARAIVKRRKAVRNIRKITKTMQMIATAKFQKSLKRAVGTKPYTQKVRELVRERRGSAAGGHDAAAAGGNRGRRRAHRQAGRGEGSTGARRRAGRAAQRRRRSRRIDWFARRSHVRFLSKREGIARRASPADG